MLARNILLFFSLLMFSGCYLIDYKEYVEPELTLLWYYKYDSGPIAAPLLHDNRIITYRDDKLISVDMRSGEMIWEYSLTEGQKLSHKRFAVMGNILAAHSPREIIAWDLSDGTLLWEVDVSDSVSHGRVWDLSATTDSFIAVYDHRDVIRIAPDGGMERTPLEAELYSSVASDGLLYIGQEVAGIAMLGAYDLDSMDLLWRFDPGADFGRPSSSPPVVDNGTVYFGTDNSPLYGPENALFALEARTGKEIWRQEGVRTRDLLVRSDTIYVAGRENVWALERETGRRVWETPVPYGNNDISLDFLAGYVYMTTGKLHVLNAETGVKVNTERTQGASSVAAGAGRIYTQNHPYFTAWAPWGYEEPLQTTAGN